MYCVPTGALRADRPGGGGVSTARRLRLCSAVKHDYSVSLNYVLLNKDGGLGTPPPPRRAPRPPYVAPPTGVTDPPPCNLPRPEPAGCLARYDAGPPPSAQDLTSRPPPRPPAPAPFAEELLQLRRAARTAPARPAPHRAGCTASYGGRPARGG